jgi:PIN domain nuclease of toxin-antitoxin system
MRLLLDTHVWIWSVMEPHRLTPKLSRVLEKAGAEGAVWLSPVSVWEAMLLNRQGKLDLKETITRWVQKSLLESGVREAAFTYDIAVESECLALPHGDPADHFIVATAKVMGLVLVTSDRKILSAKACEVLEA